MVDVERLEERIAAVERVVVDGERPVDDLADRAELTERLEALESRVDAHERRLAELEGAIESLEGVVVNVESVNRGVERRANAAVAAVDRLEEEIESADRSGETRSGSGSASPSDDRSISIDRSSGGDGVEVGIGPESVETRAGTPIESGSADEDGVDRPLEERWSTDGENSEGEATGPNASDGDGDETTNERAGGVLGRVRARLP